MKYEQQYKGNRNLFNPIRPELLVHTLSRVVSIWLEIHKWVTGRNISPKLCKYVHKPFSTHLSETIKLILIVLPELNINWGAYNFFVISGHFDAMHGLGLEIGLGIKLEVGLGLRQAKHGPPQLFKRLCIIPEH